MFCNPGPAYVCQDGDACYFRFKMRHTDWDAEAGRERERVAELRDAAIADIKRRYGIHEEARGE